MNFSSYLNQKLIQFNISKDTFIEQLPRSYKNLAENWFLGNSKPNRKSRLEINSVVRSYILKNVLLLNEELKLSNEVIINIIYEFFTDQYELNPNELESINDFEIVSFEFIMNSMKEAANNLSKPEEEEPSNLYKF